MADIAKLISDGADTFLKTEFLSIGICTFFFALVIAFVVEREPGTYYVTIAFLYDAVFPLIIPAFVYLDFDLPA